MALPSLIEVSDFTAKTMRRFTISVLAAYVATILSVIANHRAFNMTNDLFPYIATCFFSFPFAMAVDIFMESKKFGGIARFFSRILVLGVIGVAYYFVFKNLKEHFELDGLRSFLMFLAAAVLVFLAPFFCRGKANSFWQFSISLIVRFFQAFVYFGILFIGIVLLIQSVNYLFQLNLGGEYFGDAWFIITGIFVSVFFLSGVPANYKSLEQTTAYPKFLRVLTEYFLVPLVSLYLIVLYVYSAKILITWEWPKGGVAPWIMGFSTVGVLTYFFIYSIKEKFLRYVEFYRKWFFVAMLPLLLVLGLSIWIRIKDYGVTQDRYFVVAFGVWALVMAVFYLISRSKNLKFMAISLFGILLLTMFGPQSVFEVSKISQMNRLESILVKNGILVNGKVTKIDNSKLTQDDAYAINSIMNYVAQNYGVEVFQAWFTQNLNEIKVQYPTDYWTKIQTMEGYMGLDVNKIYGQYAPAGSEFSGSLQIKQECDTGVVLPYQTPCMSNVAGYSYFMDVGTGGMGAESAKFFANNKQYFLYLDTNEKVLNLRQDSMDGEVLFSVDLVSLYKDVKAKYPNLGDAVPIDEVTLKFPRGTYKIHDLSVNMENKEVNDIQFVNGYLLLY